jgi:hypothetical protein
MRKLETANANVDAAANTADAAGSTTDLFTLCCCGHRAHVRHLNSRRLGRLITLQRHSSADTPSSVKHAADAPTAACAAASPCTPKATRTPLTQALLYALYHRDEHCAAIPQAVQPEDGKGGKHGNHLNIDVKHKPVCGGAY